MFPRPWRDRALDRRELDEGYLAGHLTNIEVAAADGLYYRGLHHKDIARMLDDIPVIDDIRATVNWLRLRGIPSVICTLAWRRLGEVLAERYGFVGSSGPV